MAGPIPLLGLLDELRDFANRRNMGQKLVGGGIKGAAIRGLLGMDAPENATKAEREVYENAARASVPVMGLAAAPAAIKTAGRALKDAPRAQALETARQNAVKMLGLPENNTAMDRARALGFDTDVLHGQAKTPERRIYEGGFYLGTEEPSLLEMVSVKPGGGRGEGGALFAVDTPFVANSYAVPSRDRAGAVYPLIVRSSDFSQAGIPSSAGFEAIENFNRKLDKTKNRYFREQITGTNKGGVVFRNVEDAAQDYGIVPASDVYAIKNAPVRSRFAAFDPARMNENDLLASLAAMGISIPMILGLLDEERVD
jgi:hypothetical protein